MNKDSVKVVEKIIANPKLAQAFFSIKSLKEAHAFSQNFSKEFSISDLLSALDEISDSSLSPEELKYVSEELAKPVDFLYLNYLLKIAAKSTNPNLLVCLVDDVIDDIVDDIYLNQKLKQQQLSVISGGKSIPSILKKLTSVATASMIALTGTMVSGKTLAPPNHHDNDNFERRLLPNEKEESKWETIKKKVGGFWSKIPKPIKAIGAIGLASVPIAIGGHIIYEKKYKLKVEKFKADKILIKKREEIRKKANITDLDKLIFALTFYLQNSVNLSFPIKACLAEIDLLQLNSEDAIREKIKSLDGNIISSLFKILEFQISNINKSSIENSKQKLLDEGFISKNEQEYFDQLLEEQSKLAGKDLNNWINSYVYPHLGTRLKELVEETLKKHDLTLENLLGEGQSGSVYLCTDKEGQKVAVKIIPEDMGTVSRMGFKNEKNIWKQIRDIESDNLVKYKNQFNKSGLSYFVMEYVEGKELIHAEPKDKNEIKQWSKEIFQGLCALHSKNIIHRDIKLENIFITKENKAKICDFGMAKHADQTMTYAGTPGFIPLEVEANGLPGAQQFKYSGKKFDVYSASILVYCLMFGKKYAVNENIGIKMINKNDKDIFGNPVGENFVNFLKKCTADKPEDRPTMEEALELLEKI